MAREANLACACCGASCKGRHWWNRDKGFGLCPSCYQWMRTKGVSEEEIHHDYGVKGLHFHATEKGEVAA